MFDRYTLLEVKKDIDFIDLIFDHYNKARFCYPYKSDGAKEFAVFERAKNQIIAKYGKTLLELRQILHKTNNHSFVYNDNWREIRKVKGCSIWEANEKDTNALIYQVTNGVNPNCLSGYYYNLKSLLQLKNLG